MSNADQYRLETPENIEVDYELAGLGSRFCAMFIDTLLMFLMGLVLLLGMVFSDSVPFWPDARRTSGHWIAAAILAFLVVLFSEGYFLFFEWIMRGQTPGKRQMKIRVIRDDGTPITGTEVLIRNILRLVDFLPFGYALGAIVMFPSPLSKRLGDLAAGTIVVKEGHLDYRAEADGKYRLRPPAPAASNAELTVEERRLLTGFLQRRTELLRDARRALAERLAKPLFAKYGGEYGDAEDYLERLVEGRHHGS